MSLLRKVTGKVDFTKLESFLNKIFPLLRFFPHFYDFSELRTINKRTSTLLKVANLRKSNFFSVSDSIGDIQIMEPEGKFGNFFLIQ